MQIISYNKYLPQIDDPNFIAFGSHIIGRVKIGKQSSIWFNTVIRGDVSSISIGKNTNIQDGSILHVTRANHLANKTGEDGGSVEIADNVTVGHACIIHAATIGNNCFVGMGSILLDGSKMAPFSMLAAGSLLVGGKIVPSGELWGGRPAKFMRHLSPEEQNYFQISADNYWSLAQEYLQNTNKD